MSPALLLELSRLFAAEADDARDGVVGEVFGGQPSTINVGRRPDHVEAARLRLVAHELRAKAARKGNAA